MALDLSETLVIGISATALFDMTEADSVFRKDFLEDRHKAVADYRKYMLERENDPLEDGTAMPLVRALLRLNEHKRAGDKPLVEVVVMSRNSPETGVRVFNNIRTKDLPITRHAFTGGESVVDYLEAFDVDLFLTTNLKDAQRVIDGGKCAAAIVKAPPQGKAEVAEGQVRIAFDGDAVLFDESSEIVYKAEGLDGFHAHEDRQQDVPIPDGPYAQLLEKLSQLQRRLPFPVEFSPVRIAIVTARNAPAELRVIKTLRHWGVYVNEIFFLGGVEKAKVLKAFRPHIFFDDQDLHLEPAAKLVPSCKVPYKSDSPLNPSLVDAKRGTDRDLEDLATAVKAAQDNRHELKSISAHVPGFDVVQAYRVAHLVHEARMAEGARPVGRKIGFTNPGIWDTYGVREPIWGYVYDRTVVQHLSSEPTKCRIGRFAEPKIEPEIVLHFAAAPSVEAGPAEILACVDWVAHGFEIVQSHYPGWKFAVADTIANSALHGTLIVGPPRPVAEVASDVVAALESFTLSLACNGKEREVGRGTNVLGSPLLAVAHLVSVLAKQPDYAPLKAGELVTTGTITAAYDIRPGETWRSDLKGIALPGLAVDFVD